MTQTETAHEPGQACATRLMGLKSNTSCQVCEDDEQYCAECYNKLRFPELSEYLQTNDLPAPVLKEICEALQGKHL